MFAETLITIQGGKNGKHSLKKHDDKPFKINQAQAGWIAVNVLASVSLVIFNKRFFSDGRIQNMLFTLVSFHLMCTILTLYLLAECGVFVSTATRTRGWITVPLCIAFCMNVAFAYASLARSSLVVYQISCALTIQPLTSVLNYAFLDVKISRSSGSFNLAVFIGSFLVALNHGNDTSALGLLFGGCATYSGSIYTILNVRYAKELDCTSFQILFNHMLASLGMTAGAAILFDIYPSTMGQVKSLPWTNISISGVLVSAIVISQFKLTQGRRLTRALGFVKACVIISIEWFWTGVNSIMTVAGVFMVLGGFFGYRDPNRVRNDKPDVSFKQLAAVSFLGPHLIVPILSIIMIHTGSMSLFRKPTHTHSFSDQCFRDPRTHDTTHYTAEQAAQNLFDTCATIKPSLCEAVPNIVHLVFIGGNLKFHQYASIKSIREVLEPGAIFLHGYDNESPNEYFRRAIEDFNLTLIESRVPSYVFDRKVDGLEHRTDVLRLETLINYGGMYFDLDVFILKPMTELHRYESVMGPETPLSFWTPNHLASNVLMSKRCSEFMLTWYDNYRTFNDSDWAGHAIHLPGRLFFENSRNLHVEPRISTNYDESFDFYEVPAVRKDWSNIFCVHLCIRGHDEPTEQNYRGLNNEFGNLIRYVMDGDPLNSSCSGCKDNIATAPFYIVDTRSGRALDISESSCDDGTLVLSFPFHGGDNQKFRRGPNESIISVLCNKAIETRGSECGDGALIQLSTITGEVNQKFQMGSDGEIVNAKCNKVVGVVQNGLILRGGDEKSLQRWIVTYSAYFWLVDPATGKVLDVAEGDCKEGTNIVTWEFHGESNQRFLFDGSGNIVNEKCRLILDAANLNCDDGTALQLSKPTGDDTQRFELQSDGTLLSKKCNKVVDISADQRVILRKNNAGDAGQQWRLRFAVG